MCVLVPDRAACVMALHYGMLGLFVAVMRIVETFPVQGRSSRDNYVTSEGGYVYVAGHAYLDSYVHAEMLGLSAYD